MATNREVREAIWDDMKTRRMQESYRGVYSTEVRITQSFWIDGCKEELAADLDPEITEVMTEVMRYFERDLAYLREALASLT